MTRPNIVSPCIKVCAVDGETSLCLGCGRTLKEIGGWMQFDDAGRDEVISMLPERLDRLRALGKLKDGR
ncbi:MAG: DUF1289 domain-containing protein [Henriciella sp.]